MSKASLPAQLNATIGRAEEIEAVAALLRRDDVRLLTLTGAGGVGKTRLALEVARVMLLDIRDGIYFVSLAPLREHGLVLSALAQALDIEEVAHYSLLERLKAHVQDRQSLLVLDNFEHVLEAASLLAELLAVAPQLKILVTSRAVLHLYGEREFEVLPLALPKLSQEPCAAISSTDAMMLFVERAQAVKPSFILSDEKSGRAVAEICVQLDGLPLAIELAAARIKLLSPQSILERLQSRLSFLTAGARNLPRRQQTLRNTLDWSYDLLSEQERRFFRHLGVFVGNWTLEAAQVVGQQEDEQVDALELFTSLVDKSLVRVLEHPTGEMRFMLLETIREYALDCLERHGERAAAERRHAQYYLGLAEEAEPYLYGTVQGVWLERLDREAANLWKAMRVIIASREATFALRLASALSGYLQLRGSSSEGRNWLEEALALDESAHEPMLPARTRVLYGAGVMAHMRNDLNVARSRLDESRLLAARVEDRRTEALALGALAMLELHQGNYENARVFVEEGAQVVQQTPDRWCRGIMHTIYGKVESKQCNFRMARTRFHVSLVLLREAGDLRSQADTLLNLGTIMRLQGKLKTTQFLYAKSLGFFQAVEDRWNQVACLNGIADVLRLQGHYAEARGRFEECLSLATSLGNHAQRAAALTGLGQIAMHQGDMRRAARYLHESLRLTREIAHTPGMATLLLALGDLERCQGNNTAAIDHYESALSLTRKIGDKVGMANALFGLGDAARAQHEDARACVLLKQSLQVCWEIGDQPGMAVGLEIFAWFCRQIGLLERSVQFLATADALLDWLQIPLPPPLLTNHERELSMLRAELDEAIFKETWSYGRTMTLKLAMSMVARVHMSEHQPPPSEKAPVPAAYPANLTAREVDVLRLVASGLPDARIAEQLVLSPRTVNTHLRSIYAKIGVSSRSAATRWAFEHKLV